MLVWPGAMTDLPESKTAYIAEMLGQLYRLATGEEREFLRYLIDMAALEANRICAEELRSEHQV